MSCTRTVARPGDMESTDLRANNNIEYDCTEAAVLSLASKPYLFMAVEKHHGYHRSIVEQRGYHRTITYYSHPSSSHSSDSDGSKVSQCEQH